MWSSQLDSVEYLILDPCSEEHVDDIQMKSITGGLQTGETSKLNQHELISIDAAQISSDRQEGTSIS